MRSGARHAEHAKPDRGTSRALLGLARQRSGGNVDDGLREIAAEWLVSDHAADPLAARESIIFPRLCEVLALDEHDETRAQQRAADIALRAAIRACELVEERNERQADARAMVVEADE